MPEISKIPTTYNIGWEDAYFSYIGAASIGLNGSPIITKELLEDLPSGYEVGWAVGPNISAPDANTIRQANGTNAQTYELAGSDDGAGNSVYVRILASTTDINITADVQGTYSADPIDIKFIAVNGGKIRFGEHSAIAAETVTGYVTIKDALGTERKLAVVS